MNEVFKMAEMEETNFYNLNDDCLHSVFYYLPLVDQLMFSFITKQFDSIIVKSLRTEELITSKIRGNFTFLQAKQLVDQFSSCIKHLDVDERISKENGEFYDLLSDKCPNLTTAVFCYATPDAVQYYLKILKTATQIESVRIRAYDWGKICEDPDEYRPGKNKERSIIEALCNNLHLKSLHLSEFCNIRGVEFHKYANLEELIIERCENIKNHYLIKVFRKRKLKKLNVVNCDGFVQETLRVLVETQGELEYLVIGSDVENIEIIGQLTNLKHLVMYDYRNGSTIGWLSELVKYHACDMETLQIVSHGSTLGTEYSKNLLMFRNLTDLRLPNDRSLDDAYLEEIAKQLTKLKKLRICTDTGENDLKRGIFAVATKLKYLRDLVLFPDYKFKDGLLGRILDTRKSSGFGLLRIYMAKESIPNDILQIAEDNNNRSWVQMKELAERAVRTMGMHDTDQGWRLIDSSGGARSGGHSYFMWRLQNFD